MLQIFPAVERRNGGYDSFYFSTLPQTFPSPPQTSNISCNLMIEEREHKSRRHSINVRPARSLEVKMSIHTSFFFCFCQRMSFACCSCCVLMWAANVRGLYLREMYIDLEGLLLLPRGGNKGVWGRRGGDQGSIICWHPPGGEAWTHSLGTLQSGFWLVS